MKIPVSALLLLGVLAFPLASPAQEVAGRIVVAVGDVTIVRGGQKISVRNGTEVRAGDTVQLGAQSNAQVLFTDTSIVALRPETQFRISEYAFQGGAPETGRAFFNLLKGGLRTVTGLIGRRNHDNYSVGTPVATIGIRGTNYSLVHCDNNCRNADGSLAPNGTYGGVTDGRIGVTNQSGVHDFGADQYFRVASQTSLPQQIIAPPGFLSDKLEGRGRATRNQAAATGGTQQGQQQGQQQSSAAQTAPTGQNAGTGDSRVSSSTTTFTAPASLTTTVFQVNNQATTSSQGLTNLIQASFSGTVFYHIGGMLNIVPTACGNPPCKTFVLGEITLGINYAAGRATVGVNLQNTGGDIINLGTPASSGGVPITISGNQVVFSGTVNLADFPQSRGAFRCRQCGPGNTPGFESQLSFSGTINGAQATVTLSAMDSGGGGGSITVTLPQATPPNNSAAAYTLPNFAGGASARSSSYWNASLDGSGRLLSFGPLVGAVSGNVAGATNTIVGSAPGAGNLVWGKWGNGAQVTDFNYTSGLTVSAVPWITGDATNSIPASLGTQTFTMIPNAWIVNNGNGIVNAATLTADFVNRNISLNLNVSRTNGELNTFQMNGSGGFNPSNSRFSQGFNSVTCSGPCTGAAPSGSYGGFFAGSQAQGAGVAFTAGNGSGNGVNGVVGLQR